MGTFGISGNSSIVVGAQDYHSMFSKTRTMQGIQFLFFFFPLRGSLGLLLLFSIIASTPPVSGRGSHFDPICLLFLFLSLYCGNRTLYPSDLIYFPLFRTETGFLCGGTEGLLDRTRNGCRSAEGVLSMCINRIRINSHVDNRQAFWIHFFLTSPAHPMKQAPFSWGSPR
ncbi:hypothetical protein V8C26DRAFT_207782 [Trichoderma gracile]